MVTSADFYVAEMLGYCHWLPYAASVHRVFCSYAASVHRVFCSYAASVHRVFCSYLTGAFE